MVNQRCEICQVLNVSTVRNFDSKMLFNAKDQFHERQGIDTELGQRGGRVEYIALDAKLFVDELRKFAEGGHNAYPKECLQRRQCGQG